MRTPDRRRLLAGGLLAGLPLLGGCDSLSRSSQVQCTLRKAEQVTRRAQRALARDALAPEYGEKDISADFRANGSVDPADAEYRRLKADGFRDYRLQVGGLVERPLQLSLAELRRMPSRTQITKHDCVEGWTSIGKWKGTRLSAVLRRAGLRREARFIVFHCFDALDQQPDGERYYESIGLDDAFHEQTILAWEMNDRPLPIRHGAPVRLRVERQLGYKHAKYIRRIEAVESFAHIGRGKGGYWEDRGYDWYAGI
ncbi:MAG: molybdopterin-dependent oxidoreductase [Brevundimonas sp.]|jgi:DMSO/TMAO reductase YedYZ molybdopterin-dependent catalytic subunit|uniref:molybdopterin-dependent oxidoreductase n=1 Tax=Brevundimonas sp. TaxID=1871086 RepID=UPI0017E317A5|nr:molybdopterin-dependent oxidoreductase [Brevundimonas sp.]MBA4805187.1 molybdopterin-dependent oxidoreductase [Brevundimonas sp.]